MHAQRAPQRNEALLIALLFEVNRARTAFRAGRSQPVGPGSQSGHVERAGDLATAMETYADAAASAGVPLPYRYRDELRLYRAITRDPSPTLHRGQRPPSS